MLAQRFGDVRGISVVMLAVAMASAGCGRRDEPAGGPSTSAPSEPRTGPADDSTEVVASSDPVPPTDLPLPPPRTEVLLDGRCRLPVPSPRNFRKKAENVVFATLDGQELAYDVLRPRNGSTVPAVILIHGGGWRAGERGHVWGTARSLAALGYAGIPVDYRLVDPEGEHGRFPAPINDVRCAIRHVRAHASDYGIDPARIGVLGFSAGGHLAALAATASDVAELEPECPVTDESVAVQAMVSYFGAHDLSAFFNQGAQRLIRRFLGPGDIEALRRAASPITYVDSSDPPTLLVHGRRDAVVPIEQSRAMLASLQAAGVRAEMVEIPSGMHGFSVFNARARHPRATCATIRFLESTLGPVAPD